MTDPTNFDVSIDQEFQPFIPAALQRLAYIYPALEFSPTERGVSVNGKSEVDFVKLKREVTYQIYRERVFQQTLPMRHSLYAMLAR